MGAVEVITGTVTPDYLFIERLLVPVSTIFNIDWREIVGSYKHRDKEHCAVVRKCKRYCVYMLLRRFSVEEVCDLFNIRRITAIKYKNAGYSLYMFDVTFNAIGRKYLNEI